MSYRVPTKNRSYLTNMMKEYFDRGGLITKCLDGETAMKWVWNGHGERVQVMRPRDETTAYKA